MGAAEAELAERLRGRRKEIEQTTLARAYAISDPRDVADTEYAMGLRASVGVALDYAIGTVEDRVRDAADARPPELLLSQARAAARNDVGLDTVLRRYLAGYTLLSDLLLEEAERQPSLAGSPMKRMLRKEAAVFDRLIGAVAREYTDECEGRSLSPERRRAEQVRMLLAGEPVDPEELRYDLDAWHLAAVAMGPGIRAALRELATSLECRLLLVRPHVGILWAWFGGPRRLDAGKALGVSEALWPAQARLAFGESGRGVEGWRLSHREAEVAMAVARRGQERCVRHAEVSVLAAALRDEVFRDSLRTAYLVPLEAERDRSNTLLRTLQAYFAAGRNASSAAATLDVTRQTVSLRLRAAEQQIGRPLEGCAAELQTALQLRDLDAE